LVVTKNRRRRAATLLRELEAYKREIDTLEAAACDRQQAAAASIGSSVDLPDPTRATVADSS
jgi:hypothetical protein